MGIIRKIISGIVLLIGVCYLVCTCLSTTMDFVWTNLMNACSPFDFGNLMDAVVQFMSVLTMPIVLTLLGLIGLTTSRY